MSINDALQKARKFISAENGIVAPLAISEEELNPQLQDDQSYRAKALEPTTVCIRVPYQFPEDSRCSEFAFFEDGRQRTVQVGFIPTQAGNSTVLLPVHFFVTAAVILQRANGDLKVWGQADIEQGILIERSLVPNQATLAQYEAAGLSVIDLRHQGGDYYDLRRKALQEAKARRLAAETRLIDKWASSEEATSQFLVVDGTLMNLRNEKNIERCVGVSKSFGTRYFDASTHNRIMGMREFERSWTFRFHSDEDPNDDLRKGARERISWYLRLRSRPNTDPEFGLIRVEISKHHRTRASEYASRFSRSLLSERLPTSYPAPRWDKHLYPISACESYLSSVMPSMSTINAAMKG